MPIGAREAADERRSPAPGSTLEYKETHKQGATTLRPGSPMAAVETPVEPGQGKPDARAVEVLLLQAGVKRLAVGPHKLAEDRRVLQAPVKLGPPGTEAFPVPVRQPAGPSRQAPLAAAINGLRPETPTGSPSSLTARREGSDLLTKAIAGAVTHVYVSGRGAKS